MAPKQDFGHLAKSFSYLFTAGCQFDFINAGNIATVDTDEVRVRSAVLVVFADHLKPPNMISQLGPAQ